MHHLLAFYNSALANVANTDINGVADVITRQNNHFVFPERMIVLAAWLGSATMTRGRFWQPSLRQVGYNYFCEIDRAASPTDDPNYCDYSVRPIPLVAGEEIAVEATSAVAMTERAGAFLWVARSFVPAPAGPVVSLYGTSTTAATADAWSQIVTTWNDTLRGGRYGVVGLRVQSTTGLAARLIFEDQLYRPGGLSTTSTANKGGWLFRRGNLGLFGTFDARAMPQVEVMCDAADAAHDVQMDVVPLSGQYS